MAHLCIHLANKLSAYQVTGKDIGMGTYQGRKYMEIAHAKNLLFSGRFSGFFLSSRKPQNIPQHSRRLCTLCKS